ncbi:MAG: 50S ribosomal protein L11 methyltransferase [Actinomycetota bacterium]|nr:50S ribosomal protein L11 methyltransferase [Actinomycetota bacterium]
MIRLAVRCRPEQAELVLAELVQMAPGGVEEEAGPGWVEYAIYGAEGELPDLGEVEAAAGGDLVEITSERIPDDWADRWRDFHEPTVLANGRVVIRPSWRENPQPDGPLRAASLDGPGREGEEPSSLDVVIDPGQAFGTGAHPTTRMCVDMLVWLADEGRADGALADLGTGSAVLAIVAAKLGWLPVVGVDHEESALAAAAENAALNGVNADFRKANLRAEPAPFAPTMVANLTAPVLRDVAVNMAEPPRALVLSGLLVAEARSVAGEFEAHGLKPAERLDSGDWSALLLTV